MSTMVRRGPLASLPAAAPRGELLVTLDTAQLFMALGAGNGQIELTTKIHDELNAGANYVWSINKIKSEIVDRMVVGSVSGIRLTISGTAPADPVANKEVWVDTVNNLVKRYSGTAWVPLNSVYA